MRFHVSPRDVLPRLAARRLGTSLFESTHAWRKAQGWNNRWQATQKGELPSAATNDNLSLDQSEELSVYPAKSLGRRSDAIAVLKSGRERRRGPERTGGAAGSGSNLFSASAKLDQ